MKATGVIRKVDNLGRMSIPMELRKLLKIGTDTPLEICVNEDQIILQKYNEGCAFCGSTTDTIKYKNRIVCNSCIETFRNSNFN